MPLEAETRPLSDWLGRLGFNLATGHFTAMGSLYVIPITALIINNIFYVIYKWDNIDDRVIGIKSITNIILLGAFTGVAFFNSGNLYKSVLTMEMEHYRFPYETTIDRMNMTRSIKDEMEKLRFVWLYAIIINAAIGCVIPLLAFAKTMYVEDFRNVKANQLLLLMPVYYPENYKEIYMFFIAYFIQNSFHVVAAQYAYFGVLSSVLSMQKAVGELKLLRLSIEELDSKILIERKLPEIQYVGNDLNYNAIYSRDEDLLVLKSFLRYFVKHHQDIYRKMETINQGMQWFVFVGNFGVSMYLCLGIFYIVMGSDLSEKMQEIGICSLWLYSIYCYDNYGEMIQTEDENLRTAVYGCSWTVRSGWFKKSVQIILTRMTKPTEMKPMGLFVLNLKNFAMCVNAAYSYYNLLNKVN